MTSKLIASTLAALALTGCASGGHSFGPPMSASAQAAPGSGATLETAGFIGPDGPVEVAPPQVVHALETGIADHPTSWTDPDSGAVTQFTVMRLFQKDDNSYCRGFSESVTTGSKTNSVHGVACRDADGTWRAASG
jgi:surface antigen